MDELRLSLLIFGTCFIIAVLAHGIWKIRKNKTQTRKERIEPGQWHDDSHQRSRDVQEEWSEQDDTDEEQKNYDDLGLGEVRVVSSTKPAPTDSDITADEDFLDINPQDTSEDTSPEPVKLYGSVVTNPKPHMKSDRPVNAEDLTDEGIPEPPGFLIRKDASAENHTGTTTAETEQQNPLPADDFQLDPQSVPDDGTDADDHYDSDAKRSLRKRGTVRRRQEPNFGDDQMNIDFDESQVAGAASQPVADEAPLSESEQEVLVLNVRAPEESTISGATLLPLLLTLGFKFGDQDIFHRHVNSNGKGPVLFSLANMFKPGVFDIDNLETFSTQGVSLFMILPIEGDAHQVFNMMHNAARKIADEFNAQILDGRRSVLTKQGLQQYMEKIREFERRRMITRT